ncbi:unnamed protein product [marine sediment metagenome]|uniref:HMA domain-containing protein n=1 Tax=marine sediment metagenome TaxID=412755 RepID=X0X8B5_9ZZZZ
MQAVTFFVKTGKQSPLINKMLQAADLADSTVVQDSSGFEVTVEWKDGEIVDAQRIAKTQQNLQKAFESLGFCVLSIMQKQGTQP